MDEEIKETIMIGSSDVGDVLESNYNVFDEWWDVNIEVTSDEETLSSSDMWIKFRNENKTYIKENDMTVSKFKQYIKTKLPHSKIIIKSKNANSAYELKGLKLKEKNEEVTNTKLGNDKMDIVLKEIPIIKKVNSKKSVKNKVYFDEHIDNKILAEYSDVNNDIMNISELNDVKPWEVVSLLVKYNIIGKRSDARGYDMYKETDEYKSKMVK